jgi:hypothetical protein
MAWLIAAAFHGLVFLVFYQFAGGKKIIHDFVAEVMTGQQAAPPKPPPPPKHNIEMVKPQNITPKFEINTAVNLKTDFKINFQSSTMDLDAGMPNFATLAKHYSSGAISGEKTSLAAATNLIRDQFNLDITPQSRSRRVERSGVGKRMRATLNLAHIATTGTAVKAYETGAKHAYEITDLFYREVPVYWDFVLRRNSAMENARSWLRQNTHLRVNENTLTIDLTFTYDEWCQRSTGSARETIDSLSGDFAKTAVEWLGQGVYSLYNDRTNGANILVEAATGAFRYYIRAQYQTELTGKTADSVVREIALRGTLRPWRERGLKECLTIYQNIRPRADIPAQLAYIKPLYLFLRQARILENPLIIVCNPVGLDRIPAENLEILRNYALNGGFIWMDETGLAEISIRQDAMCRAFISQLLDGQRKQTMDGPETKVFQKLTADDRAVSGFGLGDYFPEVLNHPDLQPDGNFGGRVCEAGSGGGRV